VENRSGQRIAWSFVGDARGATGGVLGLEEERCPLREHCGRCLAEGLVRLNRNPAHTSSRVCW
jgi:hypothetical protein